MLNELKLKQIKEYAELVKSSLTHDEFLEAFKKVLDFVKQSEKTLNDKIDGKTQSALDSLAEIKKNCLEIIEKLRADNEANLPNIKKWVLQRISDIFIKNRINEKIADLDAKVAELDNYEPPDASTIALEASKMAQDGLLPLIPIIDKLEEKLPQMGGLMADALEALPDKDKLKIDAVSGLRELLEEIRKIKNTGLGGIGGFNYASLDLHIKDPYVPTGTINGVNKDFTLSSTPSPAVSLKVYRGGALQSLTEDYTVSGITLTFIVAPVVGEIIKVEHRV